MASTGRSLCTVILALLATSCTLSQILPTASPEVVILLVSATPAIQILPYPTSTPAHPPVSADELLSNAYSKLPLHANLDGLAIVSGQPLLLAYPQLAAEIVFAIEQSIASGEDPRWIPYTFLLINSDFLSITGVVPQRQIASDLYYAHYCAWQRDLDGQFLSDRADTTFSKYLDLLASGADGSHSLLVNTLQGFPGVHHDEVRIDPVSTRILFILSNLPEGFSDGTRLFDQSTNTLIFLANPTYPTQSVASQPEWTVLFRPYMSFLAHTSSMALPSRMQVTWPGRSKEPLDAFSAATIACTVDHALFRSYGAAPLHGHSPSLEP